jgi:hypothetical protein
MAYGESLNCREQAEGLPVDPGGGQHDPRRSGLIRGRSVIEHGGKPRGLQEEQPGHAKCPSRDPPLAQQGDHREGAGGDAQDSVAETDQRPQALPEWGLARIRNVLLRHQAPTLRSRRRFQDGGSG